MGGSKPGPLCVTTAEPIDPGTRCRNRSRAPGVLGMRKPAAPPRQPIRFSALWAAYPGSKPYLDPKTGAVPKGFENQCAIKVSVALAGAGEDLSRFVGASVTINGKKAAVRAEELAAWLRAAHLPGLPALPEVVTGAQWQAKVKDRTGIIFFADYWLRPGEKSPTGDHIDLWNGSRLTASGLEGALVTFARFGLGIDSGPGFSDLGKARTIWFWEVR